MKQLLYPDLPVLLVDDEKNALNSMEITLKANNINNIVSINNANEVLPHIEKNKINVILLDLIMPEVSGDELLKKISSDLPDIPIIIVTGESDISTAVKCMKNGAFDYILKPVDKDKLVSTIRRAINFRELQIEYSELKNRFLDGKIESPAIFKDIITNNEKMKKIFLYMEAISKTNKPVLITGETGVGKELIAKAIHKLSGLSGNLVSENASGLNDTMFSDTFFGHAKGAYTGAQSNRKGLIEDAEGGTLFLDEIGDLSMESQIKLLRLLQENVYRTLGSDILKRANTRIIAATNCDLEELQASKRFRKDLYYRFKTHHIHIPPLRDRMDDLPILIDHFLEKSSTELNKNKPTPPPEIYTLLNTYNFPGNIRELEAMIFNAVSNHKSKKLSLNLFKKEIGNNRGRIDSNRLNGLFTHRFPTLKEMENLLISESLKLSNNNKSIASSMLGISRQALSKRIIRASINEKLN